MGSQSPLLRSAQSLAARDHSLIPHPVPASPGFIGSYSSVTCPVTSQCLGSVGFVPFRNILCINTFSFKPMIRET